MPDVTVILYATLGGFLPALLWLWFFLREDKRHPEPKSLLLLGFIAGMLAVFVVLPIERYIQLVFDPQTHVLLWAAAEEFVKFALALALLLWRRAVDEPIDAMVYMITVALGFAALESALFLLSPFLEGDMLGGILTGNLRFLGAALIHTLSSAIVGAAVAFSFYKSHLVKGITIGVGLVLATILHALFNFFIISSSGRYAALVFFMVWLGVVALFLLFEKAKRITG